MRRTPNAAAISKNGATSGDGLNTPTGATKYNEFVIFNASL